MADRRPGGRADAVQGDVEETFRQVSLYFLSPLRNSLVPDTVLVPELPGLSTKLVSRLLRGPTTGLRGCGRDGLPAGDRAGGAVGAGARRPGDGGAGRAGAQGGPGQARADVGADRLDPQAARSGDRPGPHHGRRRGPAVSGVPEEQGRGLLAHLRPRRAGRRAVRLRRARRPVRSLHRGQFEPVPGPAGTGALPLATPAVSLDANRVAAVSTDGTTLRVGRLAEDGSLDVVVSGGDLGAAVLGPAAATSGSSTARPDACCCCRTAPGRPDGRGGQVAGRCADPGRRCRGTAPGWRWSPGPAGPPGWWSAR